MTTTAPDDGECPYFDDPCWVDRAAYERSLRSGSGTPTGSARLPSTDAVDLAQQTLDGTLPFGETWHTNAENVLALAAMNVKLAETAANWHAAYYAEHVSVGRLEETLRGLTQAVAEERRWATGTAEHNDALTALYECANRAAAALAGGTPQQGKAEADFGDGASAVVAEEAGMSDSYEDHKDYMRNGGFLRDVMANTISLEQNFCTPHELACKLLEVIHEAWYVVVHRAKADGADDPRLTAIRHALGLSRSIAESGERWTAQAAAVFDEGLAALNALRDEKGSQSGD